ncbi:MAG: GNAT family protein [Vulcanimicrobiaceae bacterium]
MKAGLEPIVLEGAGVRLEPLTLAHLSDLQVAGAHEDVWRWLPSAHHLPGSMRTFVCEALELQQAGLALPFAIVDLGCGRAIGSTRYHFIEAQHRRLEIGFTWTTPAFQRTHVNTAAKYLLLRHAFVGLGYRRVEFKVDAANAKSRAAVLRLGACEEGCFRKHMLYPDGRNRDSVYYSIVDDEWPAVERRLAQRLAT